MLQILFVYIPVILFIIIMYVCAHAYVGAGIGWVIGAIAESLSDNKYLFYKDEYMGIGTMIGLVAGIISIFVVCKYLKDKKNIDLVELVVLGGIAQAEDPKEAKKREEDLAVKATIDHMYKCAERYVNRELELEMRRYVSNNKEDLRNDLIQAYTEAGIDTKYIFLTISDVYNIYGNIGTQRASNIIGTQLKEAIMIKMAQQGYLPRLVAHGGYSSPSYPTEEEWYINTPNLMMYVTNQLKQHGFKDDIWASGIDLVYYKVGSMDFFLHPRRYYLHYNWTTNLTLNKKRGN